MSHPTLPSSAVALNTNSLISMVGMKANGLEATEGGEMILKPSAGPSPEICHCLICLSLTTYLYLI